MHLSKPHAESATDPGSYVYTPNNPESPVGFTLPLISLRDVRFTAMALLLGVGLLGAPPLSYGASDPNPSPENIEATSQAYEKQLSDNANELANITKEIAQAEQQRILLKQRLSEQAGKIEGRDRRIRELNDEVNRYEQRLQAFEQRVTTLESAIGENKQRLSAILQSSLYATQDSGWKLLLNHSDPTVAARVSVYLEYLMRAQRQQIGLQAAQMLKVGEAKEEALKSRNWLQHIKNKASNQKIAYTNKQQQSRHSLQQLQDAQQERKQSASRIVAEQQELTALLQQLAEAVRNRTGFFESRKGRHPWPTWSDDETVRTKLPVVKARFGDKKASGKLQWSGTLISAAARHPVHAIADGEVVYADRLSGLGLIVVLEHGDGYLSLYGGIGEVLVNTTDWIESGATIATVAESGGPIPQGLYLEIRQNAKPLNPEVWLAGKNRDGLADK